MEAKFSVVSVNLLTGGPNHLTHEEGPTQFFWKEGPGRKEEPKEGVVKEVTLD